MNPTHAKRKRPTVQAVVAIDTDAKTVLFGEVSREEWLARRAAQLDAHGLLSREELAGMYRFPAEFDMDNRHWLPVDE